MAFPMKSAHLRNHEMGRRLKAVYGGEQSWSCGRRETESYTEKDRGMNRDRERQRDRNRDKQS